jgi:hypothetical protein
MTPIIFIIKFVALPLCFKNGDSMVVVSDDENMAISSMASDSLNWANLAKPQKGKGRTCFNTSRP